MAQVYNHPTKDRAIDPPGGGGDDGGMEVRVSKLEALAEKTGERLVAIERDLAVIKATGVSKEDLHKELHATTWKLVVAIVLAQLLPALPTMLKAFGWIK
ncbi:hypothetical protein [Roseateles puraquae]|uniref:hypothetical protein n=1 Tax=Roseateles puraquae TaxID=431059 RepID=UPI0031E3F12B